MSEPESGSLPPPAERQCPHQDPKKARRRRVLLWLAFAVLILLLVVAAGVITLLVVLRPRDPVTELVSVKATGVLPGVVTLPAVSVQLNLTFDLVVRVRNPNPVAFRHGPATTSLYYRGAAVAYVEVPAGTMPSRGSALLEMNMTVQADRVVAAAGIAGLIADVLDGEMEFEARNEIPGTVVFLRFIKRHIVARAVCRVVVGVADAKVRRQECDFKAKL